MSVAVPGADDGMLARAQTERRFAQDQRQRVEAASEQRLIDAEVHASRRALVQELRCRIGPQAAAMLDEDFLATADLPTVYLAILNAAQTTGGAAAADLQVYDARLDGLRIVAHRGFTQPFLDFFATVGSTAPTACAAAWTTRRPVLVDDVSQSDIFSGHDSLEAMLEARSRTVHSYPLLAPDGTTVRGVLSLHYPEPPSLPTYGETIARCSAEALWHLR